MFKKYTTKNFKETQKLGEKLAEYLSSSRKRGSRASTQILDSRLHGNDNQATVLCLQGDLGGGKTTFLQGLAKGIGIKEKILSPTFIILKKFVIPAKAGIQFSNFYHIDCYRLNNSKDIDKLGIKDILSNSENIVAIEWSERIKKSLPKSTIIIKFNFVDKNKREICIFAIKKLK